MSLADAGIKPFITLPESPKSLAYENVALADFLNELNRPIGLITPDRAPACALAGELTPETYKLIHALGETAGRPSVWQHRRFQLHIKAGFTDFGDRLFSLMPHYSGAQPNSRTVANLMVVDGQFLFGQRHSCIIPEGQQTEREEIGVSPLNRMDVDKFNAIGHRAISSYF